MNGSRLALGAAAVCAMAVAGEREASACGGCFTPPNQTVSDITDERMLLSVSTTQSTLYDQIQYSGSPADFAWVLPIRGTVTVGLSADVLFDSIDTLTATQINPPPLNCPASSCRNAAFNGAGTSSGSSSGASDAPPVVILAQANVGPYATVQLQSTDPNALTTWLLQNNYLIPPAVQSILASYVSEHFDFLAMKLQPGQGVQAMRPVRVTMPGASLSLPLRMASIGTGAITGITIWVVADSRYQPKNFPFFHIDDSQLVWDWKANISNYTTLRVQNEADFKNGAWEIESSIDLNKQIVINTIMAGGQYYGGGFSAGAAPAAADQDYLPVGSSDAGADGGYESAEAVRDDDITTLFAGLSAATVRVTRIRSDIAQAAMTQDINLTASPDQSELSNVRNVTKGVNLVCPVYSCGAASSGSAGNGGQVGPGPAPSTSSGCNAAHGTTGSAAGFGALAGALGLVLGRAVRVRRRRQPSKG